MKKNILIIFIIISSLYSNPKRLSFEDVQGKSPFKYTSLNILTWVPNENTYITRIKNTFLKVDIMNSDSSIFLTDEDFRLNNKNIIISKAKTEQAPWRANFTPETFWFDSRGEKILFITNKEKIWRRSFYASYYVMDLKTKKIQSI